ncbi:hypothetical protein LCGC14_0289400 [marine sediment metagenome]|uniref:Uncharacterized protein n=1 Tax=marine sediment metagenome TaxID=412755 RepID=A0A0F9WZH3_9ZZZZ
MPWERDADMRVRAQEGSASVTSDGNYRSLRSNRVGALYAASALDDLIRLGYGYCAGIGLLSAGEPLPNQVIVTLRPTLWVRVPSGVTIRPFYGAIQVEDTGATNAFEALIGSAPSDVGNGTSDAADFGPVNLRTGLGDNSGCTVRQEASGDVDADVNCNLWRAFKHEDNVATPATAGPANFEWKPTVLPALVGPATLALYVGGGAIHQITAQLQWIVEPTAN